MKIIPPWILAFGIVTIMLMGLTLSLHWSWVRHLEGPIAIDRNAERARLLQADADFSRLFTQKGPAAAFHAYLAEDAVQLPAATAPLHGKDAVFAEMKSWRGTVLTWEPQFAEVARAGDMGYTWGYYEARTPQADGTTKVSQGKYANVWRRGPDGQWKVVLDVGNSDPAGEKHSIARSPKE